MDYLKEKAVDTILDYWGAMDQYEDCLRTRETVAMLMWGEEIDKLLRGLRKTIREIKARREMKEADITEDMIRRAKDYPFQELHTFTRNMALCPFHEDHNPSMSLKDNRVRCWSCGWKGDTIAFYMEKNGRSFADSVRALQ